MLTPAILLDERKIARTIVEIPLETFTVLDFIRVFQKLFPSDWESLIKRYGSPWEKRKYTINTYLSNWLDVYSQKPHSLLKPFTRYSEAKFKDYRRPTPEEHKYFKGP